MRFGIIGGTGSADLLPAGEPLPFTAGPWGSPSASPLRARAGAHEVLFLPRHGPAGGPVIPPHRVNYRANLWLLRELGVDHVVGVNAVGGISPGTTPGRLVIPHQLIDYTWGREHTYTGDARFPLAHVDFTAPFSAPLRDSLLKVARELGLGALEEGVYGATQGPRLESAAEIDRLERDGCDIVGMTGMPEAGLARELGLSYALCCVVVNRAAGRGPPGETIHDQMAAGLGAGMASAGRLLRGLLASTPD
mgnify:CR=1 FL=1